MGVLHQCLQQVSLLKRKRDLLILASVLALPIWEVPDDKKYDAHNTAKNERDSENKTLTPADQSNKPEERKQTQRIARPS